MVQKCFFIRRHFCWKSRGCNSAKSPAKDAKWSKGQEVWWACDRSCINRVGMTRDSCTYCLFQFYISWADLNSDRALTKISALYVPGDVKSSNAKLWASTVSSTIITIVREYLFFLINYISERIIHKAFHYVFESYMSSRPGLYGENQHYTVSNALILILGRYKVDYWCFH